MTDDEKTLLQDALAIFVEEWAQLPPLARAGLACSEAHSADKNTRFHHVNGQREHDMGLNRRAKVSRQFEEGQIVLYDLFRVLARQADAEAVRRGIDCDTTGDG